MSQTNNQVFAILKSYNDSISPRRLILLEEATANPALNTKWLSNFNIIRSFILSRWGGEETPCTFARVQQAVSALHKNGAGLQWMDGKQPGISRDQKQPESEHKNTQADLIERQEAERKAKVDAATLANAQSRCSNYDCQPHSVRFDRRNRLLAEFKRLSETPGITAEQVAKGVDQAIIAMEKSTPAPQPIRGV
jgi:hypothetical protein